MSLVTTLIKVGLADVSDSTVYTCTCTHILVNIEQDQFLYKVHVGQLKTCFTSCHCDGQIISSNPLKEEYKTLPLTALCNIAQ